MQPQIPKKDEQINKLSILLKNQEMKYVVEMKTLEQKMLEEETKSLKDMSQKYQSNRVA